MFKASPGLVSESSKKRKDGAEDRREKERTEMGERERGAASGEREMAGGIGREKGGGGAGSRAGGPNNISKLMSCGARQRGPVGSAPPFCIR